MDEIPHGAGQSLAFELPNVGEGPEEFTAEDLESASGVALVVLLRNHHCPLSRRKVRALGERIEAFEEAHVTVAVVLPDTVECARIWQRRYDLSFPLLADPAADAEEREDPEAFGAFDSVAEWMPQRPGVALVATGDQPTVRQIYSGSRPQDCPSVAKMLDVATDARNGGLLQAPSN